jgi:hypothetical protein
LSQVANDVHHAHPPSNHETWRRRRSGHPFFSSLLRRAFGRQLLQRRTPLPTSG